MPFLLVALVWAPRTQFSLVVPVRSLHVPRVEERWQKRGGEREVKCVRKKIKVENEKKN